MNNKLLRETYYCWKVVEKFKDEPKERFVTPPLDIFEYGCSINYIWDTPKEAEEWLKKQIDNDYIKQEEADNFVLVRVRIERIHINNNN